MTSSTVKRVGYAILSYATLAGGLRLAIGHWVPALGWGAVSLVILAYVVNSIREIIVNKVIAETYKGEMEAIADSMVANVECSFCHKPNAVRFTMNDRNEFECEHCGKPNLLIVNASTAQITVPLAETKETNS